MHGSANALTVPEELPVTIHTEATAIPLNVLFRVAGNDRISLRVLAGGGILTNAHWKTRWETSTETVEQASPSVTRPYGQAGLETGWWVRPSFQLTGRVLGRLAQANHVDAIDGSDLAIDHTGIAFALGARFGLSL
jgi:hypothetical protein